MYQVEVYQIGEDEPLITSKLFNGAVTAPVEVTFTPPEDGDYLLRVMGRLSSPSREGRNLVRYRLELERGE